MRCLNLLRLPLHLLAGCTAALAAGCSSLQIDVDVYKGPLTQERHIQVRQYAAMAAAAKPLIRDMYEQLKEPNSNFACGDESVNLSEIKKKRARFLCEILQLYITVKPGDREAPIASLDGRTQSQRATSRDPELGLDKLTFAVAQATALTSGSSSTVMEKNIAVDRLSEALILFAQKLVYITNNELLFADDEKPTLLARASEISEAWKSGDFSAQWVAQYESRTRENKQWENYISVLQALGNTILVHANDLQRQTERDELHVDRSASLSGAVQQAFQPEPSATVDGILYRLTRFSLAPANDAADIETLDTATPQQKKAVEDSEKILREFKRDIAPLLAAYCTLFIDVPAELVDAEKCVSNQPAVVSDRGAIGLLYDGQHAKTIDGLQPLDDWLTTQTSQEIVPNTNRLARLTAFKGYLFIEQGRLRANGITDTTTRADAMKLLTRYLARNVEDARATAVDLEQAIANARGPIIKQNQLEAARLAVLAREAKVASDEAMREKMTRVVRTYRSAVIGEAESLGTRDPEVITAMLLRQMKTAKDSTTAAKTSGPTPEERALTTAVVKNFSIPKTPCHVSVYSAQCKGKTTIEVLDNLIAALRAQHVQAVAAGNEVAAVNLLKAVNAAYDQRTAMIYLRPASDYLRSVYASTTLQEGAEDEYRNMLAGWMRNLRGNYQHTTDAREKIEAKRELDKINWQNVNKVTLSGGGFTNYVIAKDDVGNWYVKAYGSDPEAIIKSATSLALFNTGKGVNVKLLRRVDVQRRLDEDKSLSDSERAALQKEVGPADLAGGQALMKVRDRYAARYLQDTLMQAAALLATMKEVPSKTDARLAEVTTWAGDACTQASAGALLKPLDVKHLTTARDRLAATVSETATPGKANPASLVQTEKNIQAGLTALHLYGSDVQHVLRHDKGGACDAAEHAARLVRDDVRAQVVAVATARRASIERYEDALTGVLDIASEK